MTFDNSNRLAAEIGALAKEAMQRLSTGSAAYRLARRRAVCPIDYMRYAEFEALLRVAPLRDGITVLDIGSPQWLTLAMAKRHPGARFTYINIIDSELDPCREVADALRLMNIRYLKEDARSMSFDAATFDLTWSISVIEHIFPEQGGDVQAIIEITRVMKPHGQLYLTVPCKSKRKVVYTDGFGYGQSGSGRNFFAREYDRLQFSELIFDSGCEVVNFSLICEKSGLLAVDNMEWGQGHGKLFGERLIKLRRYPERLLSMSFDQALAQRYLVLSSSSDERMVNIFAAVRPLCAAR